MSIFEMTRRAVARMREKERQTAPKPRTYTDREWLEHCTEGGTLFKNMDRGVVLELLLVFLEGPIRGGRLDPQLLNDVLKSTVSVEAFIQGLPLDDQDKRLPFS